MPGKELIKTDGENIYPVEVEEVILEQPMIQEISVIGVPDKKWGEAIEAVCIVKKGGTISEHELIDFVGQKIARYKKQKYIVFTSRLSRTKDGSVDREQVKQEYEVVENT
jgi:acyl-CoA synthetase (AMP-forming)/AMP-acid ligase II